MQEELLLWLLYLFGGEGGRQVLLHLLPLGLAEVVVCGVLKVGLDLHAHTHTNKYSTHHRRCICMYLHRHKQTKACQQDCLINLFVPL